MKTAGEQHGHLLRTRDGWRLHQHRTLRCAACAFAALPAWQHANQCRPVPVLPARAAAEPMPTGSAADVLAGTAPMSPKAPTQDSRPGPRVQNAPCHPGAILRPGCVSPGRADARALCWHPFLLSALTGRSASELKRGGGLTGRTPKSTVLGVAHCPARVQSPRDAPLRDRGLFFACRRVLRLPLTRRQADSLPSPGSSPSLSLFWATAAMAANGLRSCCP